MNLYLGSEMDDFVERMVASGEYLSRSEVLRDALRLMMEREQLRQMRLEELRKAVQVGLDQVERGECGEWNMEEILKEARLRMIDRKNGGETTA